MKFCFVFCSNELKLNNINKLFIFGRIFELLHIMYNVQCSSHGIYLNGRIWPFVPFHGHFISQYLNYANIHIGIRFFLLFFFCLFILPRLDSNFLVDSSLCFIYRYAVDSDIYSRLASCSKHSINKQQHTRMMFNARCSTLTRPNKKPNGMHMIGRSPQIPNNKPFKNVHLNIVLKCWKCLCTNLHYALTAVQAVGFIDGQVNGEVQSLIV